MPRFISSRRSLTATLVGLVMLGGLACTEPPTPPTPTPPDVVDDGLDTMATSTKGDLLWKRGRALRTGLAEALFLPEQDVCSELGRFDCVDFAHQVALGGNDPFVQGQYEPQKIPSATTSVAFERVVLSACSQAVEIDANRAAPILFRGHDLTDTPLNADDPVVVEGATFLGNALYERLHARKPRDAELAIVPELLRDDDGAGVSGKDFAKLACFAIASTSETLFY